MRDLAAGLSIMHAHNVIFCDIKSENVLIHIDTNEKPILKFIDFGLSVMADQAQNYLGAGTPYYMAFEILAQCSNSMPSDVYGLCALFWELMNQNSVFAFFEEKQIRRKDSLALWHAQQKGFPISESNQRDYPNTLLTLMKNGWSTFELIRPKAAELKSCLDGIANEQAAGLRLGSLSS